LLISTISASSIAITALFVSTLLLLIVSSRVGIAVVSVVVVVISLSLLGLSVESTILVVRLNSWGR